MSRILTYREALREGLDEELARDPNVVVMGELNAPAGRMGLFGASTLPMTGMGPAFCACEPSALLS